MSFLFADSFETVTTNSHFPRRGWIAGGGAAAVETTIFKNGTQSMKLDLAGRQRMDTPGTPQVSHGYLSFWFYFDYTPQSARTWIDFTEDTNLSIIRVRLNVDKTLNWFVSGTGTIGSASTFALPEDEWMHVEVKWRFADSISTDDCVIKINGVEVLNMDAATDTRLTGGTIGGFRFLASDIVSEFNYFDSPVFWDGTGGDDWNDFRGQIQIETKAPDANGPDNDFDGSDGNSVDNFELVDETLAHDANTTHLNGSLIHDKDSFNFPNMVETNLDSILGVQIVMVSEKTQDVDITRGLKPFFVDGGADFLGARHPLNFGVYEFGSHMFDENPDSAVAWTPTDITSGNFGVQVVL